MSKDRFFASRPEALGRRSFLRAAATTGLALGASAVAAQETPPRRPEPVDKFVTIPKRPELLKMGDISEFTVNEHWKLYEGYVNKSNEILGLLKSADPSKANATYSEWRELKVELSFALDGMKNHRIYFGHLGGDGSEPQGGLADLVRRDFGSYEDWKRDIKATGIAARGWAWLCFDYDSGRLHNYIGDSQNTFPVWNAVPLVALDVYEHAFFHDFGTRKGDYIDAFFKHLDWRPVETFAQMIGLV